MQARVVPGPRVLLARGRAFGVSWTMSARGTSIGLCVNLMTQDPRGGNAGGGGCGPLPSPDHPVGGYQLSGETGARRGQRGVFITGALARKVVGVRLRLRDGRRLRARVIPAPPGRRMHVHFFVAAVPAFPVVATATATGRHGKVLARWSIAPTTRQP
jgi:hypothetical protein